MSLERVQSVVRINRMMAAIAARVGELVGDVFDVQATDVDDPSTLQLGQADLLVVGRQHLDDDGNLRLGPDIVAEVAENSDATTSNVRPREKVRMSAFASGMSGSLSRATASISSDKSIPSHVRCSRRCTRCPPVPHPTSSNVLASSGISRSSARASSAYALSP
jgi:hypothetical protein